MSFASRPKYAVLVLAVSGLLLAGGVYLLLPKSLHAPGTLTVLATYASDTFGFTFTYPAPPDGYVLKDIPAGAPLIHGLVLMRVEDAAQPPPIGGEGPATITVQVFENTKKQSSRAWAETNSQYSNSNIKIGGISDMVVGGANAVRYVADGLYASNVVVVAHGQYVYLLSGMYLDVDSALYRDFEPIVQSLRFVPTPGQE